MDNGQWTMDNSSSATNDINIRNIMKFGKKVNLAG